MTSDDLRVRFAVFLQHRNVASVGRLWSVGSGNASETIQMWYACSLESALPVQFDAEHTPCPHGASAWRKASHTRASEAPFRRPTPVMRDRLVCHDSPLGTGLSFS